MTSLVRLASYRVEDTTRDLLGKEVSERLALSTLDPDADEAVLARIGAYVLSRYLPGEILAALNLFSATGHHMLLLSNLPAWNLPPTPVGGFGAEPELAELNAIQLGLIQLLGVAPFAVDYENSGRLMRNVVPNPAAAGKTSSWGSDSEFFWHTDNPHLPFGEPGTDPRLSAPRYLTFYGMRNEERVPTEVATVEHAARLMDEHTWRQLQHPTYTVGAPASIDRSMGTGSASRAGTPLVEIGADGYRVRYDRGTTTGQTAEAAAALEIWAQALTEIPRNEVVLEPGDFLIFDNYRVLHRRKSFTPRPVATARWLRRCYAS